MIIERECRQREGVQPIEAEIGRRELLQIGRAKIRCREVVQPAQAESLSGIFRTIFPRRIRSILPNSLHNPSAMEGVVGDLMWKLFRLRVALGASV